MASFPFEIVVLAAFFFLSTTHSCITPVSGVGGSFFFIVILNSGAWGTALGANIYIKEHSAVNNMQSFCAATTKKMWTGSFRQCLNTGIKVVSTSKCLQYSGTWNQVYLINTCK